MHIHIHIHIYLFIYLFISLALSLSLSLFLSLSPSLPLSLSPSLPLSLSPSLPLSLSPCLSRSLSLSLAFSLPLSLSPCLSRSLSLSPSVSLSLCLSFSFSLFRIHIRPRPLVCLPLVGSLPVRLFLRSLASRSPCNSAPLSHAGTQTPPGTRASHGPRNRLPQSILGRPRKKSETTKEGASAFLEATPCLVVLKENHKDNHFFFWRGGVQCVGHNRKTSIQEELESALVKQKAGAVDSL